MTVILLEGRALLGGRSTFYYIGGLREPQYEVRTGADVVVGAGTGPLHLLSALDLCAHPPQVFSRGRGSLVNRSTARAYYFDTDNTLHRDRRIKFPGLGGISFVYNTGPVPSSGDFQIGCKYQDLPHFLCARLR